MESLLAQKSNKRTATIRSTVPVVGAPKSIADTEYLIWSAVRWR
jgi:hypothetical protein